jgi:sugar phosphate isomerase/epimerase
MADRKRAPFGVAAYSFPCSCGFLRREGITGRIGKLDAWGMIELAKTWELAGIEIPLAGMLPDLDDRTIDQLRATLDQHGLTLVADTGIVDVPALAEVLPKAARAGARVVRATLSNILEGARAGIPGGWDAHFAEMRRRVAELGPLLAEYDLVLALENHQDVTSDDLLALCEAGGERVGITFDVVNPLAVGEEPFAFARRIGPRIFNVHIKDYLIYPTSSGYRLVRAAIGEGVIDWAAMRALLAEVAPAAPQHIELAALYGRHIRLLEDEWWQGYPARDVREVIPALRFAAQHARPADEPWETPWERAQPDAEVARWELDQFEASVRHLRTLE